MQKVKNEFILYFNSEIHDLTWAVQYANGSKIVPTLDMQLSAFNSEWKYEKLAVVVSARHSANHDVNVGRHFTLLKKKRQRNEKIYNARTQPLFFSLSSLQTTQNLAISRRCFAEDMTKNARAKQF